MSQFIELTTIDEDEEGFYYCESNDIKGIVPLHKGGSFLVGVQSGYRGVQESPAEVMDKIKEAQANDPLERIAVALEKIGNELSIIRRYGYSLEDYGV